MRQAVLCHQQRACGPQRKHRVPTVPQCYQCALPQAGCTATQRHSLPELWSSHRRQRHLLSVVRKGSDRHTAATPHHRRASSTPKRAAKAGDQLYRQQFRQCKKQPAKAQTDQKGQDGTQSACSHVSLGLLMAFGGFHRRLVLVLCPFRKTD